MDFTNLYLFQMHLSLNMSTAIKCTCLNVQLLTAKEKHSYDVHWFLDIGDMKSTSSLYQHVKMCWGDKAISATGNTKDLDGACTVLAKFRLKENGGLKSFAGFQEQALFHNSEGLWVQGFDKD